MRRAAIARFGSLTTMLVAGITVSGFAQADKNQLEHCDKPIGALAVVEPQAQYMSMLSRYQLGSPGALIRMMAQQSNCFVVVERGAAMQNMQQERALARAGEMQTDANMGGGQMKAADFILTPAVQIDNPNAGGVGGAVGGVLGRSVIGGVAGGLRFKEAQTSMLVADARTTVQVAAAEGKAKHTDFSLASLGWMGGGLAAGGGYTNTAEGKVIAASFLDNFNAIVKQIKTIPALMARANTFNANGAGAATTVAAPAGGAGASAGGAFAEGDVLNPKIDNVKLLGDAKDDAKQVAMLKKSDDLVFMGQEKDGYVKVQGSAGEGWVKKSLVGKH